jgi:hypothetical protein
MAVGDEVKEKQDRNQKNTFYSVKRWVVRADYSENHSPFLFTREQPDGGNQN